MPTHTLFIGALILFGLFELRTRILERLQGRGGYAHDAGTQLMIVVALYAAVALAALAAADVPSLSIGGHTRLVGLILVLLGLALRIWAVLTLGRSFRTTVEVDVDQEVVEAGPYRLLRHPSYTALLLLFAGLGIGLGNWLGLAALLVLPTLALLRRIHVEEAELTRVLGAPYTNYASHTKRLVPGVW